MPRPDWENQSIPVPDITGSQKKSKKAKSVVKPVIHNVTLLDCSGSMQGEKWNAANDAIKKELEELSQDDVAIYKHSVVCFRIGFTSLALDYCLWNTTQIQSITLTRPNGGTPLNDAILTLVERLEMNVLEGENVVFKIYTDGEENSSRSTYQDVSSKIAELRTKNWVVTFIGTEYDVQNAISHYGIDASNTLVHKNTGASMSMSFAANTVSMQMYAKRVAKGNTRSLNFYDNSND